MNLQREFDANHTETSEAQQAEPSPFFLLRPVTLLTERMTDNGSPQLASSNEGPGNEPPNAPEVRQPPAVHQQPTVQQSNIGQQPSAGPPAVQPQSNVQQPAAVQQLPGVLSGTTITTVPNSIVFKPKVPNRGGLVQISDKCWEAFTGGKSNDTCDGLAGPAVQLYAGQLRPIGSYSQKCQALRVKHDKNRPRITKKTKISRMKRDLFQSLVEEGLDSITYLPDAKGKAKCVILESDAFDMTSARDAYARVMPTYDNYDLANDHDASTKLLNTVDEEIRTDVELFHQTTSGFIVIWYEVLGLMYNSNIDRKRDLEAQIRTIKVSQYPQQDLSKMVADFLAICEELDDMDSYNHDNTIKILEAFAYAGGGTDPLDPNTLVYRNDIICLAICHGQSSDSHSRGFDRRSEPVHGNAESPLPSALASHPQVISSGIAQQDLAASGQPYRLSDSSTPSGSPTGPISSTGSASNPDDDTSNGAALAGIHAPTGRFEQGRKTRR